MDSWDKRVTTQLSNCCYKVLVVMRNFSNSKNVLIIDAGLSKSVNAEHARDLPLMNGIKEDIKTIIVLDSGSSSLHDALFSVSTRLKSLQVRLFILLNEPM